jgi:hypothetical protein
LGRAGGTDPKIGKRYKPFELARIINVFCGTQAFERVLQKFLGNIHDDIPGDVELTQD